MNITQWQECGYKTIIKGGEMYLYRPLSGIVIHTPVNGGQWMNHDDVNKDPWTKEGNPSEILLNELGTISESCYCGVAGVRFCDFCSGLRRAELFQKH